MKLLLNERIQMVQHRIILQRITITQIRLHSKEAITQKTLLKIQKWRSKTVQRKKAVLSKAQVHLADRQVQGSIKLNKTVDQLMMKTRRDHLLTSKWTSNQSRKWRVIQMSKRLCLVMSQRYIRTKIRPKCFKSLKTIRILDSKIISRRRTMTRLSYNLLKL